VKSLFTGIDVQLSRDCPFVATNERGKPVRSGWLQGDAAEMASTLLGMLRADYPSSHLYVGIDAPRMPLNTLRKWRWRKRKGWNTALAQRQIGRHCEIVVHALGLATPQWTRLYAHSPEWMHLGFALFKEFEMRSCTVLEVFPSAAYQQLSGVDARLTIDVSGLARGVKDMLDAHVAAFTVQEFVEGRGCAIGGGDGLGAIVLPRPVERTSRVHEWPEPISPLAH